MPALLLTCGRRTDCHFSIIYTLTLLCGLLVWLDYTSCKRTMKFEADTSKFPPLFFIPFIVPCWLVGFFNIWLVWVLLAVPVCCLGLCAAVYLVEAAQRILYLCWLYMERDVQGFPQVSVVQQAQCHIEQKVTNYWMYTIFIHVRESSSCRMHAVSIRHRLHQGECRINKAPVKTVWEISTSQESPHCCCLQLTVIILSFAFSLLSTPE